MAIAQKLAGLHARPGRPAAPGDGQEEEGGPRQASSSPSRDGMQAQRLLRRRDQDAVGHPASRSPTTPSTRRTPPPTAWSPTGPPTSRPTTRPSTWPRCSPRSSDDKDKSALYLNECRRMGIKVLPPDVNESVGQLHRRSAPTSASASPRSATSARNVVDGDRRAPARRRAAFADFNDFLRQGRRRVVCNKRVIESLIKAGAFDSLGAHRAGRWSPIHEPAIDAVRRHQAQRGRSARIRPVRRASATTTAAASGSSVADPRRSTSGTRRRCSRYEREMLGLYVSDHPLFGLEHVLAAARRLHRSASCMLDEDAARRLARSPSAA